MITPSNIPRLLLASALCLTLLAAPSSTLTTALAQDEVSLPSFPREDNFYLGRFGTEDGRQSVFRLSDGDHIWLTRQPDKVPRTKFEIVLANNPPQVTWWKGITVYKALPRGRAGGGGWVKLGHIFTQDNDRGSRSMTIAMDQLPGGVVLVFEKAKAFGAHTPMHGIHLNETQDDLAGQRIIFRWAKDK